MDELPLLPPGMWGVILIFFFFSRHGDISHSCLSTRGEMLRSSVGTSVTGISF